MPKIEIDNRTVEVTPGATILDAARQLGIAIPTLCFLAGCTPSTSCMVCVVKVKTPDRLLPACAARAEEGMQVESDTAEVREARRTALELLLSDHPGDCIAPCQGVCPAHMEIPRLIRLVAAGDARGAAATARSALLLPATRGRICPAPCEKGCRRAAHDGALSIRLLHRRAADADLASGSFALPACKPATGRRVAIIGAGPAGLAAAWHLLQEGCACTVFDDHDRPGGALHYAVPADRLPRAVLDAEIALVAKLGAVFRLGVRVGRDIPLADLRKDFDAILVATGAAKEGDAASLGLAASPHGIQVDRHTYQTPVAGIFAAGDAVLARQLAVRSVGDGAAAAAAILQYLAGVPVAAAHRLFTTRLGHLAADEMLRLAAGASSDGRTAPAGGEAAGLSADEARREAPRCFHCDCRKADVCKLRRHSAEYAAAPNRYHGTRRPFEKDLRHPEIVYEPGKCIACGLCVQISARAGEPLGLAFIGRGFGVRVGVPLGESIAAGLRKSAAECVAACPTGALAFKVSP